MYVKGVNDFMGINIEKISTLNLNESAIISYGGTAKLYRTREDNFCYKEYKKNLGIEIRKIIKENLINLSHTNCPNYLVTPDTIYLDEEGNLQTQKMLYIDGTTGYRQFHQESIEHKTKIIDKLTELVIRITKLEYIVTDLKLNNLLWDKKYNFFAIDHDFTFYHTIPSGVDEFIKTNKNVRAYNDLFGELKPMYNLYRLYFILARMLISIDEYNLVHSIKLNKKNVREDKMLKTLNYFIQKNRGIPQEFKMQMRNLFTDNQQIIFDQNMKKDLLTYSKRKKTSL